MNLFQELKNYIIFVILFSDDHFALFLMWPVFQRGEHFTQNLSGYFQPDCYYLVLFLLLSVLYCCFMLSSSLVCFSSIFIFIIVVICVFVTFSFNKFIYIFILEMEFSREFCSFNSSNLQIYLQICPKNFFLKTLWNLQWHTDINLSRILKWKRYS